MINGLGLGCSDHCGYGKWNFNLPGDHVITRDCMVFQCMVIKKKYILKFFFIFFNTQWSK